MIIDTKFLDQVDIDKSIIVTFKEGIPGFEDNHEFVILDIDSKIPLKCLQSIEVKDLCLLLINPWDYFGDYEIELYDEDIEKLHIEDENDVLVYNVIAIREDKITANLVAPVIINIKNNNAKQIVFSNSKYNIRQEITCLY